MPQHRGERYFQAKASPTVTAYATHTYLPHAWSGLRGQHAACSMLNLVLEAARLRMTNVAREQGR